MTARNYVWSPVIEHDIPLPPAPRPKGAAKNSQWRARLYLNRLGVGDSIAVPAYLYTAIALQNAVAAARRRYGGAFAIRTEVGGYRIWRTK